MPIRGVPRDFRTLLFGNWLFSHANHPLSELYLKLNLYLLRELKRIVDLNTKVADRALELCVAQQQLYRPQVLRAPIDQSGFRPAQ